MSKSLADERALISDLSKGLKERSRAIFWQQCIERRINRTLDFTLYDIALKNFYPKGIEIPAFFPIVPDFGSPLHFDASDELRPPTPIVHSQRHILCLISNSFPDVKFCPLLPDLIQLLLEQVNEKTAYTFLAEMLTQSLSVQSSILSYQPPAPFFYFTTDSNAHLSFVKRFYLLLKSEHESIKHHLKYAGIDSVDMFQHWIERFFVTFFPPSSLLSFLDGYMLFGLPFFYSTILSLLTVHRNGILDTPRQLTLVEKYINDDVASTPPEKFIVSAIETHQRRMHFWERIRLKDVKNYSLGAYPHAREVYAHVPVFSAPSELLTKNTLCALWSWIEPQLRARDARLLYSTSLHGYSLPTMLKFSSDINKPTFTIIKTTSKAVFGVFLIDGWLRETRQNNNNQNNFQTKGDKGTAFLQQKITAIDGRCFVFSLAPDLTCYRLPEARKVRDKLYVEQFSADAMKKSLAATKNGLYHSSEITRSRSAEQSRSLMGKLLRSKSPTVPASPSGKAVATSTMRAWTDLVGGNSALSASSLRNSLTSRDVPDEPKDAIDAALPLTARFDSETPPSNDYLHNFALHLRQMVNGGAADDQEMSTAHMICTDDYIAIGDAVGVAISLDRNLRNGVSQRTLCFQNKNLSLSGSVDGAFECLGVEVWSVE